MKLIITICIVFFLFLVMLCVSNVSAADNANYVLWNQQTINYDDILEEYYNCGSGTYCGFPAVTRASNGNLIAAWYNGSGHILGDSYIEYSLSTDIGCTWSTPALLVDRYGPRGNDFSTGSPCGTGYNWSEHDIELRLCPNGDVILFVNVYNTSGVYATPPTGTRLKPYIMRSTDNGVSWSLQGNITIMDSFFIIDGQNYGNIMYVVGCSDDTGPWNVSLFKSVDNGITWEWVSQISNVGNEVGFVILDNNTFYCKLRDDNNDYYSYDLGLTWVAKPDTPYAEKDCSIEVFDDDTLIMTVETNRTGSVWNEIWFSDDNGSTWGDYIPLNVEAHDAYQDVIMIEDDWAYVVWHYGDYMYGAYLTENVTHIELPVDTIIRSGNQNYTFSRAMNFSYIRITDSWVQFNSTKFLVSSDNSINISLVTLHSNVVTTIYRAVVLEFNANTTGGNVTFNISGFHSDASYTIYRNDARLPVVRSDASGNINFSSNVWSAKNFKIKVGSLGLRGLEDEEELEEVDTDGDGLSDAFEAIIGTNPFLSDTDFDGYTDYEEYLAGTDPLDPNDYPGIAISLQTQFLFIPLAFWLFIILPAIILFSVFFFYCCKQKEKKKKRHHLL